MKKQKKQLPSTGDSNDNNNENEDDQPSSSTLPSVTELNQNDKVSKWKSLIYHNGLQVCVDTI